MLPAPTASSPTRTLRVSALVALLAAIALWPVLPPTFWATPPAGALGTLLGVFWPGCGLALVLAPLLFCLRHKLDLTRPQKQLFWALLILLSWLMVDYHYTNIDALNRDWQANLHSCILQLQPSCIPHCYRFLPDSYVRVIEALTGNYSSARSLYRFSFGVAFLFALYVYSRRYLNHLGSLVVLIIYVMFFPLTLRAYGGQLTDPMSHLSFVLAFLFIEQGLVAYLTLSLLLGILAKESVLLVAGCYFLNHFRFNLAYAKTQTRHLATATLLGVLGLWLTWWIRHAVNSGAPLEYQQISHVTTAHIYKNLTVELTPRQIIFSLLCFVPFTVTAFLGRGQKLSEPLKCFLWVLVPGLLVSSCFLAGSTNRAIMCRQWCC